ncbi:hypothetical protein HDU92_003131 [Lobulomyces angularis]|nr:hypothetical protein HDU92_003131 [Lobulomyces angularis]
MSLAIPNATASSKSTTSIANRSLAGASMNSFYKGQPTTVPINNARLSISKNQINTNNECSTKLLDFLLITKKLHKSCIYYSILATSQLGIIIFSIYLMLNNDTLKTFDLDYGGHTWLIVNFILLLGTLLDLPIKFSRRVFLKLKNLFTAKTVALERFEAIYHFYVFTTLKL